ncbi:MAG: glutathione synthase [Alphaproteobacteria bacterium]
MAKSIAFQMDPLGSLNQAIDSSLILAKEGMRRGYKCWHFTPQSLAVDHCCPRAQAAPLVASDSGWSLLAESSRIDLNDMSAIFIRQDPPFDMAYITSTFMLDHVADDVVMVNNPAGIRNGAEKFLPLKVPQFMPPTVITADRDEITRFWREYKDIILKPLYDFGGSNIFRVQEDGDNLSHTIDALHQEYKTPIIAQRFIPGVSEGDKRIIMVDGEPVGGFLRVPQKGDIRSNMVAGGTPVKSTLTDHERQLCEKLSPILKDMGILFAGIDVIAGYLTEVNVTSPTGIAALNALDGIQVEQILWDVIEEKM